MVYILYEKQRKEKGKDSILYRQKISSVNNFVPLQRKGVCPVVNFVHGS